MTQSHALGWNNYLLKINYLYLIEKLGSHFGWFSQRRNLATGE